MNEKEAVLNVLESIYALDDAFGKLTEVILADSDETPDGYEWWDEILGDADEMLCKVDSILSQRYHVDPSWRAVKKLGL